MTDQSPTAQFQVGAATPDGAVAGAMPESVFPATPGAANVAMDADDPRWPVPATDPFVERFMREWSKHENAPRTTCAECHFESSEGYPPQHAPGCSQETVSAERRTSPGPQR